MAEGAVQKIFRGGLSELFRRGEVLPEGRTLEEEVRLIGTAKPVAAAGGG